MKKLSNLKTGVITFLVAQFLGFETVFAADAPLTKVQDIVDLARKVGTWVATIFWIAAVGAIFYAGFLYLTAGDDTERVKKAKKQLMYSIIAIALGVMAYGMPELVKSFLSRT